jgi:hypothetical protein
MRLSRARPLTFEERALFVSYFSERTLTHARIVEGRVPFWLNKKMCAVVLGCTIYFRSGIYQPQHIASIELLAHELTHVEQFLSGMTILKYLWASRRGYLQNPYEIAAYAKSAAIRTALQRLALAH